VSRTGDNLPEVMQVNLFGFANKNRVLRLGAALFGLGSLMGSNRPKFWLILLERQPNARSNQR
jgi:hypothetical protein